jgi:recombination protein RecA
VSQPSGNIKNGRIMVKSELAEQVDFTKHLRNYLNKAAKEIVAYDLEGDNPTQVRTWISTGSTLLDYIISNRRDGGIPVGKVTTFAGDPASGKSLLAAQILANTQKMGGVAVYIDTENAADPDFLKQLGVNTKTLTYLQPGCLEEVFENIENIIKAVRAKNSDKLVCIVWDSIAGTPTKAEIDGDYDPNSRIGLTAKALAKGMRKLTETLGKEQIALVFTNQLKVNIGTMFGDPRVEPGGKAVPFHASTRIWLTRHEGANGKILDENKQVIGYRTSATTKKSRFGPSPRKCSFDIMFDVRNDFVGVADEDSWLEATKSSPKIIRSGSWYTINLKSGEKKFQAPSFARLIRENSEFKEEILDILEEECSIRRREEVPGDKDKVESKE